jgi:hypothetical protein
LFKRHVIFLLKWMLPLNEIYPLGWHIRAGIRGLAR